MANDDIQGTITDSSGNPISGATVYLVAETSTNKVAFKSTDSNGYYKFTKHPDADGMPQEWHVAAYYEDGSGNVFNSVSQPKVSASLSEGAAISSSVVYDLETGDTSRWDDVNDLSATTSQVYAGSYAGICDNAITNGYQAKVNIYDGGRQPSEFEFFWRETSFSYGGGLRLLNSDGEFELGLATDNPGWAIDDGSGVQKVYSGDGYDRWIRFTITFDWSNGEFSADFEDLSSGSTYTDSGRQLKKGKDLEVLRLEDYTGGTWQDGDSMNMWFDNISFTA